MGPNSEKDESIWHPKQHHNSCEKAHCDERHKMVMRETLHNLFFFSALALLFNTACVWYLCACLMSSPGRSAGSVRWLQSERPSTSNNTDRRSSLPRSPALLQNLTRRLPRQHRDSTAFTQNTLNCMPNLH